MVFGFVTSNMTKVSGREPQGCIGNRGNNGNGTNGRLFYEKQKQASTRLCTIFYGTRHSNIRYHSTTGLLLHGGLTERLKLSRCFYVIFLERAVFFFRAGFVLTSELIN